MVLAVGDFIRLREKPRPLGRGGIARRAQHAPVPASPFFCLLSYMNVLICVYGNQAGLQI